MAQSSPSSLLPPQASTKPQGASLREMPPDVDDTLPPLPVNAQSPSDHLRFIMSTVRPIDMPTHNPYNRIPRSYSEFKSNLDEDDRLVWRHCQWRIARNSFVMGTSSLSALLGFLHWTRHGYSMGLSNVRRAALIGVTALWGYGVGALTALPYLRATFLAQPSTSYLRHITQIFILQGNPNPKMQLYMSERILEKTKEEEAEYLRRIQRKRELEEQFVEQMRKEREDRKYKGGTG